METSSADASEMTCRTQMTCNSLPLRQYVVQNPLDGPKNLHFINRSSSRIPRQCHKASKIPPLYRSTLSNSPRVGILWQSNHQGIPTASPLWKNKMHNIIRILNCCEVRIENSVTRISVRQYEACRTTIAPNNHYRLLIFEFSFSSCCFKWSQIKQDSIIFRCPAGLSP